MLPVEELVRFDAGLDAQWHHPVADALGSRWGLTSPAFVRSSASHVLVADGVVLRLRPEDGADALRRGAEAARAWHRAGVPFVDAVASQEGRLVEVADGYAAMALRAARGPTLEESDDVVGHAAAWGGALASLHAATPHLGLDDLPVAATLELPRGPEVFGVLHGDPEADNVVLTAHGLVLVDPDEIRVGWFAADVAFALRDWSEDAAVVERFLAGYREVRPFTATEESWLPRLAEAAQVEQQQRLAPHLAARPDPAWPEWAHALDARLRHLADPS